MHRRRMRPKHDAMVFCMDRESQGLEPQWSARPFDVKVVVEDEAAGEIDEENRERQKQNAGEGVTAPRGGR